MHDRHDACMAAPTRGRQTGSSSYWTNSVKFLPAPLQMRVLSATRWGGRMAYGSTVDRGV